MRSYVVVCVLASVGIGCGDEVDRGQLPPETFLDDKPAALSNQARAVLSFHAAGPSDHFTCGLDNAPEVTCTSPVMAEVADGEHVFVVRAAIEDTVDETPIVYRWTVDTVAPETVITAAPPALDNAVAPEVVFEGSDNHPAAVSFECALDDAAFAACSSPATLALIADGGHVYRVRAIDGAGNVDATPASVEWTLDSTAPETQIASGPAAGSFTRAAVSFTFGSPDSPVTFECALDGAAFTACASPKAYTLAEGAHTFAVRAKDAAGLADPSPATRAWMVDLTPPVVAITSGPTTLTSDPTPTFGFTVTGATVIDCQVDGGALTACASPFTTGALADGSHTFAVRGRDAAGNAATQSRTFTVDTVPPTVTVSDVASPTRDTTPSVSFTAPGAASTQCQVDGGAPAACSSPFTTAALADGSHTVTVRATDAAGNTGSDATSFTVDATPPAVAIDDAPPALWPVNYYDVAFHTTDATATLSCAVNGGAFTACTSPFTVTTAYNTSSSFVVRATDPAGNVATTAPRTWTAQSGLVLHYPWEQGQTHNTSLLAQRAAYSPDGVATLVPIGGWAGTAANSPAAHAYKTTIRPLSSSPGGQYTASVWVRVAPGSNGGVLFSTLATGNGIRLRLEGRQVVLQVNDNGQTFTAAAVIPPGQWVQVGVVATGPAKGVQLLVNGNVVGSADAPTSTGFGPGQAPDLTVGPVFDVDVDDLRFYNRALSSAERCTILVRGEVGASGACVPLAPGMELDFERNQIADTGTWNLPISIPSVVSFLAGTLGTRLRIDRGDQQFFYNQGFAANVNAAPGRSFSFWFVAGQVSDVLFDFLHACSPAAGFTCGIRVQYIANGGLVVVANGGAANPFSVAIPLAPGLHSVVVTEQKANANGITAKLSIYVDGVLTTLPIGSVNVYAAPGDTVALPRNVTGTQVDEYEFWPRDLSADPEMLCENGWDGEWNPANSACLLTSN